MKILWSALLHRATIINIETKAHAKGRCHCRIVVDERLNVVCLLSLPSLPTNLVVHVEQSVRCLCVCLSVKHNIV